MLACLVSGFFFGCSVLFVGWFLLLVLRSEPCILSCSRPHYVAQTHFELLAIPCLSLSSAGVTGVNCVWLMSRFSSSHLLPWVRCDIEVDCHMQEVWPESTDQPVDSRGICTSLQSRNERVEVELQIWVSNWEQSEQRCGPMSLEQRGSILARLDGIRGGRWPWQSRVGIQKRQYEGFQSDTTGCLHARQSFEPAGTTTQGNVFLTLSPPTHSASLAIISFPLTLVIS